MIQISYVEKTAWNGHILMSREFYNPATQDYIHIEAHETETPRQFYVAFWTPDGNDGDHGFEGPIEHVLKCMTTYVPPEGFVEMAIPEEVQS